MNFSIKYKYKDDKYIKDEIYHNNEGAVINTLDKASFYDAKKIHIKRNETFRILKHTACSDVFLASLEAGSSYVHINWIEPVSPQMEFDFDN
jgi:hypothetical protein